MTAHGSPKNNPLNEILEMSRIEAGKVRLDLAPWGISSVLEKRRMLFAGHASRKGLTLSIREEAPLSDCVMTDRSKLKQILINLIGNSMKFTDFGSIDVVVRRGSQSPDILEFTVKDTSRGIPADLMPRLFLPFEQSLEDRSQGGTGLGLAICKTYCELLGGKISIQSSIGKGSQFSFSIQAPQCAPARVSETPMESRIVFIKNSAHPRILIVNDKQINRDILMNMLLPIGFEVEQAEDGEKALSLINSNSFDIVLLDYIMPGLSGRELVKALRTAAGECRLGIILMTGSLLENQQLNIKEMGVDALLAKPILERLLLSEIKHLTSIEYGCADDGGQDSLNTYTDEELKTKFAALSSYFVEKLRNSITSGDLEDVKQLAREIAQRLGESAYENDGYGRGG